MTSSVRKSVGLGVGVLTAEAPRRVGAEVYAEIKYQIKN
jgi:hypothetical protein